MQNPKWYYIGPPSVWAVLIYITSVVPVNRLDPIERAIPLADKIEHAGVFGILALFIIRGWQREKMPPLGLHGFVWLMCVVFGVTIEITQAFIPYRSFEVYDMVANAVGALAGLILWHLMMLRWGKRTRLYPGLLRPEFKNSPANRRKNQ